MIKRTMKLFWVLALASISALLLTGVANAAFVISDVELDEDSLTDSSTNFVRDIEKGDEFNVKVHFFSTVDADDVQVSAEIRGYDHDDRVEDISDVFDAKANVTYVKKLSLKFPQRLDQDRYKLRVQIQDRDSPTFEQTYELEIDAARHLIQIKDVVFSPENKVVAGRALLTTVRLQNRGEQDEEGIKVKVSIPELGISASDFIDELEAEGSDDDEQSSEEIYLRIPSCADTGDYTVNIDVTFDEGDEVVSATRKITVESDDSCAPISSSPSKEERKTTIVVGPDSLNVVPGQEAMYQIALTNSGSSARTYTIAVDGASWANFRVSPSNVLVLQPGESGAAYIFVSAKEDAPAGQNSFAVTVSSNGEVLKQVALKANISESASGWDKVKDGLEIGLIILVVLLVILGLIIGFNKLKGNGEDEEESKTYY
ncbi:hypothetical protein HY638_03165 [Candidatus Woesearchaeota archaeon]|nr:hypothetical protein [Candidatus Woesearchaeota archaeon]